MEKLGGFGKSERARGPRSAWVLALGVCVAIACDDRDALEGGGTGGSCSTPCISDAAAPPALGSGGAPDAGLDATAPAAVPDAAPSGAGAAGTGDATECPSAAECDDGNPCTADQCQAGACVYVPLADETPCNDGKVCTTNDACQAGTCTGTARTSAVRVTDTAYTFGGAGISDTSDGTGGLVAFLSHDRILFADQIHSGTLLTLATVASGSLRITAQTVTDRSLVWQPFSGWVWQSVPLAHLVALPDDRFAFFSLQGTQVFQVTGEGKLVEQWRSHDSEELKFDAAWAGGALWTCPTAGPATRYAVRADGSLSALDTPELIAQSCNRLAVAPDESVYAAADRSVMRWAAPSGRPIVPETVLAGVSALELVVDDAFLGLQIAKRYGSFGDTEVYRRADLTRLAAFSATGSDIPVGLGLVGGKLLLEWRRLAGDVTRITGAVYDLAAAGPALRNEWTLRSRCCGADQWAPNISRLAIAGGRVAFQPWRRVADIDPTTSAPLWITGPGHGEIAGLQSSGDGSVSSFSPYSVGTLDLSTGVAFIAGGMSLGADVQGLEVVLPDAAAAPSAFAAATVPSVQHASVETVTALRNGPSGIEVAGAFALDGGPARLIQRGPLLYQIAVVGDADYRVRVFDLASALLGQSPLVPQQDLLLTVPVTPSQGKRLAFEPDVDAVLGQLAVTELRDGAGSSNSYAVVWASLGPSPSILATGPVDTPSPPVVRGGQLLHVDPSRVTLFEPEAGGLRVVWSQQANSGDTFFRAVGVDGADCVYLTGNDGEALIALRWADGAVLSRARLPDDLLAAAASGNHLLLAGAHAVSVLEPACGDPTPPVVAGAGGDGPVSDGGPDVDANDPCGDVAECPEGGLTHATLTGDANGDGCVNGADTQLITACLGRLAGSTCSLSYLADLDQSGTVDTRDYLLSVRNAGHGCDGGS